ncbi:DnaD domain protein [Streptococcus equinus]|uniref:Phage replisome organizer, putative, N-terminal region n=1 Tax=Streptococcus equinus JB1 TaxID=1294274 RepID=A0A1I4E6W4_STREI|nr:DnaD domain protein [Streptococcus equinus]SFL01548.1 phage replisome organizer, putative, N-terminal region [Streptococcus equinus JB1]
MAKTKVYFWLKVDKKFFDNVFIKRLKNMNGGYAMTVIYIRLMLESLESDCILYYDGYLESLVEELAIKLDVSEDDINMTMAYFTKCGLIQIDTNGNAELLQAKAMLEQETNQAQYMREYRKRQKLKNDNSYNVNQIANVVSEPLTTCKTEIDIDKEIELKKDINIDIKSEVDTREKQSATADGKFEFNIFEYYQSRIGVLDGYQLQKLKDFIEIDNLEPNLVKRAIDRAADNSKRNFGYINSILKNWAQNGIKTIVQQDEEQRRFEESKRQPAKSDIESTIPDLPF